MSMNLQVFIAILCLIVVGKCAEKHQINLKNLTEIDQKNKQKQEDNPLKKEIRKYLRECGADVADEDETPDQKRQNVKPHRGTYPTSYGSYEDGNRRVYRDVEIFNTSDSNLDNYRDRNNNKRRGNKNFYDDYDENDDSCMDNGNRNRFNPNRNNRRKNGNDRNRNNGYDNNRNGNNNRNNGNRNNGNRNNGNRNENNRFDPYGNRFDGNEDFGVYNWGGNRGYNMYGGRLMLRPNGTETSDEIRLVKRYANDDDVQCLSQCAFGYLSLLDDNRLPSETEIIKFIQNNVENSTKRMRAIRDARRCFARLATSDNEDGCMFSKLLGKCLKLEIQDNS